MTRSIATKSMWWMVLAAFSIAGSTTAIAQRMPSPAVGFDSLLEATKASAKDPKRAARYALLARSRIIQRAETKPEEAVLKAFDDLTTGAAKRAKEYQAVVDEIGPAAVDLGPATAALAELARPLFAQAESLIGKKYKECALFVIEPVWGIDPKKCLELLDKINAITNAPEEDSGLAVALHLGDSMSRGAGGAAIMSLESSSTTQKEIEDLRRASALAMVPVAKKAVEGGTPWVALDIANVASVLFALYPKQFAEVNESAWKALSKARTDASKAAVNEVFKKTKMGLVAKSFTVGSDSIKFPTASKKAGLIVTAKPIEGDYRFAMDLKSDFEHCHPGFVFGYKSDDDFCAAVVTLLDDHPVVSVRHYVKGEAKYLYSWDAPEKATAGSGDGSWPVAFELRGKTLWAQVGTFPWAHWKLKDIDPTGAIGLFLDDSSESKQKTEASRFEFEQLNTTAER